MVLMRVLLLLFMIFAARFHLLLRFRNGAWGRRNDGLNLTTLPVAWIPAALVVIDRPGNSYAPRFLQFLRDGFVRAGKIIHTFCWRWSVTVKRTRKHCLSRPSLIPATISMRR